jgi:hypothetical protein
MIAGIAPAVPFAAEQGMLRSALLALVVSPWPC